MLSIPKQDIRFSPATVGPGKALVAPVCVERAETPSTKINVTASHNVDAGMESASSIRRTAVKDVSRPRPAVPVRPGAKQGRTSAMSISNVR